MGKKQSLDVHENFFHVIEKCKTIEAIPEKNKEQVSHDMKRCPPKKIISQKT